jgi:UDP-3-O-[3-hydroxymyristoyl] glucosamine N-acyltransferase
MSFFIIKEIVSDFPECKFKGDENCMIDSVLSLNETYNKEFLHTTSWISDKNIAVAQSHQLNLGLLILSATAFEKLKNQKTNFLISPNPRSTFVKLLSLKFRTVHPAKTEATAVIHESSKIGNNCYVGHHVVIEENCSVGDNTTILHNTSILSGTQIGNNVYIGCNNTIGNYGFGYEKNENGDYVLLQHSGNVVIQDNVEIHNNTCIDKGALGSTVIGENVKIDNLVHIAHNVVIGRNSLIIANAMIGGSAIIEENTWVAPSASIKNQIKISRGTTVGMSAVILKNTEPGSTMVGNPAVTLEEYKNRKK